jgi:sulfur carrier protein ThiS
MLLLSKQVEQKVKGFFVVTLAVIFFYLAAKSIEKYWSYPVSSKITYKYGEDGQGNGHFPAISFCKPPYDSNKLKWKNQRDCGKQQTNLYFIDFMENCLTLDENVTVEELLSEITYQPEDIIVSIHSYYITQLQQKDHWKNFKDLIFYDYFDLLIGHCLTFDVSKLTQDGRVRLSTAGGNFLITLKLKIDEDDNVFNIYLHGNKDIYHIKEFDQRITWSGGSGDLKIHAQQKIVKSLSNEETPCVQQPFWTCYIEKTVGQLMEQYNCRIPFLLKKNEDDKLEDLALSSLFNTSAFTWSPLAPTTLPILPQTPLRLPPDCPQTAPRLDPPRLY